MVSVFPGALRESIYHARRNLSLAGDSSPRAGRAPPPRPGRQDPALLKSANQHEATSLHP